MENDYIIITCKNCNKKYKVKNPDSLKRYQCKICQNPIIVKPKIIKEYKNNLEQSYTKIKQIEKKPIGLKNKISLFGSYLTFWEGILVSFLIFFIIIGIIGLRSKAIQNPSLPTPITNLEKSISEDSSSVVNEKLPHTENEVEELQNISSQSKIDWIAIANNLVRDYQGVIISVE